MSTDFESGTLAPEESVTATRMRRVIQYRRSRITDRGYEYYSGILGVDLALFAGKSVLDIGSGREAKFAMEARARGLKVISVNPNWKNERQIAGIPEPRLSITPYKVGSVSAVAQELPFANDSVDIVLSLYAIPLYLVKSREERMAAFSEIKRVLKPGGVGLLYPIDRLLGEPDPAIRAAVAEVFDDYYYIQDPLNTYGTELLVINDESQADSGFLDDIKTRLTR